MWRKTMYENLDFGNVRTALRETDDGIESIDVEIERETTASKEKLIISNIGEGSLIDVYVNLITGELEQDNARRSNPDYGVEDVEINVEDGEMKIEIVRVGVTITVVLEADGETNDNTGVDLSQYGMDI